MSIADAVIAAAETLRDACDRLAFAEPIAHVYHPLAYAWDVHRAYCARFAATRKRVLLVGMNPGPFGMAQTGVPFGEVAHVRDWMRLDGRVDAPADEHPKRPIQGFACPRSEVSGRRLWGCFAERFGSAEAFFAEHFVANYCPLVFMQDGGRNSTPDKLPAGERTALFAPCDDHLRALLDALRPTWVLGVGRFARDRCAAALGGDAQIGWILHPSPASPAANRGWAAAATRQLREQGVWT